MRLLLHNPRVFELLDFTRVELDYVIVEDPDLRGVGGGGEHHELRGVVLDRRHSELFSLFEVASVNRVQDLHSSLEIAFHVVLGEEERVVSRPLEQEDEVGEEAMVLGRVSDQVVVEARRQRQLHVVPNVEVLQSESSDRAVPLEYDDFALEHDLSELHVGVSFEVVVNHQLLSRLFDS